MDYLVKEAIKKSLLMGNTNDVHIERPDSGPIGVNGIGFLLSAVRFVTIEKFLKSNEEMEKHLLFIDK